MCYVLLCYVMLCYVMLCNTKVWYGMACWSTAEKGLTSWLLLVMFIFVTFPCGILGQMWYLIVSFPDLCRLSYYGMV